MQDNLIFCNNKEVPSENGHQIGKVYLGSREFNGRAVWVSNDNLYFDSRLVKNDWGSQEDGQKLPECIRFHYICQPSVYWLPCRCSPFGEDYCVSTIQYATTDLTTFSQKQKSAEWGNMATDRKCTSCPCRCSIKFEGKTLGVCL